jgi:hypothetical protein
MKPLLRALLDASDFRFILIVSALFAVSAALYLSAILMILRIAGNHSRFLQDANLHKRIDDLRTWNVKCFAKITATSLGLLAILYPTYLLLHLAPRGPLRLGLGFMSVLCPFYVFVQGLRRLRSQLHSAWQPRQRRNNWDGRLG